MYPAQTSLIPVTVALAGYVERWGISSFFSDYPYWYLGTTPFKYLTGPIVPLLAAGARRILPGASLFGIVIYLVVASFLFGALGWAFLSEKISKNKFISLVVFFLSLLLPWRYLAAFFLDEASFIIARNFLPFSLLAIWLFLEKKGKKEGIAAVVCSGVLFLINTNVIPVFLVGVSSIVIARSFKKGKIRSISKYIKPSINIILISLILVTFWYSPDYWLTILQNPSIGGASGFKVIFRIFDLVRAAAPLILAILTVYFSGKIKSSFIAFCLTWTLTFVFLVVFRFIGDPDFWQDWTAWFWELENGAVLIAAMLFYLLFKERKLQEGIGVCVKNVLLLTAGLFVPFLISFFVYNNLGRPALISPKPPQGVSSLSRLDEIAGSKRVFLSGSTAFWANAFYNLHQVRGGRDQVAKHPVWNKAAWEWREGADPQKTKKWLDELDVDYILIHGPGSFEYYHDFKNLEKWEKLGKVVWEGQGDRIYKVD